MIDQPLTESQWRIINYLNFKMFCAAEQEDVGVCLDRDKAIRHRDELLKAQTEKIEQLKLVMPKVPKYATKERPKVTHKKDGTPSALFLQWAQFLKEHKLPITHKEPVKYVKEYVEPNPNSHTQVKDWLYGLGWEPQTFKYEKDEEGNERKIPQVRNEDKVLCESVLELKEKEPGIEVLEGLSIIQHRLSIFEGFVECAYFRECPMCKGEARWPNLYGDLPDDVCSECGGTGGQWYLTAGIGGLTNTLRFKHRKPLVNLPKVGVPWGEEIRSCLIAPPGHVLCGSDMVSLEDTTKRHYMFPHDPDYVAIMQQPGFDPHLNLAMFAGAISEDDYEFYTKADKDEQKTERWKRIKSVRGPYKTVNYSAIYGVGAPKMSRSLKVSRKDAQALLDAYWGRNWSVKQIAKEQFVKTLKDGSMWLKNPVSGFYISLRYEKDIFSSLNQSTGVYCFDSWVALCRNRGVKVAFQFHDEQGFPVPIGQEKSAEEILQWAIEKLNDRLKLNVPLSVDVQHGPNYAKIH